MTEPQIAIVGAGLAGSLLANYLGRRGCNVTVYERRPDPRSGKAERGRSINLALADRGIDALRRIGIEKQVMADSLPMYGRMIHPVDGELDFQPYSASGDRAINSIGRAALNNSLLAAAEQLPNVRFVFDHRLVGLDPATGEMAFERPQTRRSRSSAEGASDAVGGTATVQATAAVIIGTDGAGSAVRSQLLAHNQLTESLDFLDYGYKELVIPAVNGEYAMDPGALHIWPRGGSMMIALPNPDRSFTCTLFWPTGGTQSFASLGSPAAIERHFHTHYPDVPALAPTLVEDYLHNPIGLLGTVRCTPWQVGGRVALLGDAAHAIVPFYGQGANCAFEDVVELDRCLDECGDDWAAALPLYEARRKDNAEAIAQLALDNFIEMRDRVASPVYQLTQKVEHTLARALPGRYLSRYELVSFTTIPYSQVQRRVRRQHQVVGAVAAGAAALLFGSLGAAIVKSRRRS